MPIVRNTHLCALHILGLLWLTLIPLSVSAQKERYPFVDYAANRMHGDSNSKSFAHFAKRWSQLQAGKHVQLNIVHIGSSHVQAGTLPHSIRMNLLRQPQIKTGRRGMIFPYSAAARCNNPADYRVHCVEQVDLCRNVYEAPQAVLGLCGIAVTAHDSLTTIWMVRNEYETDFPLDHIVLLGYSPDGVTPWLQLPDGSQIACQRYDTPTRRYHYRLPQAADSLAIVIPCDSAQQFTLTGVLLDSDRSGLSYHAIGVNGAALKDYLKCPFFTRDLALLQPDMVIFGIGINDAAAPDFDSAVFHQQYRQLVDSVRSVNPNCALIFITNNDSYKRVKKRRSVQYRVNENALAVREVFFRLAAECDGVVWDQLEVMGGLRSMKQWIAARLAQRDHVHFTVAGYRLIGDLFSQALTDALKEQMSDIKK